MAPWQMHRPRQANPWQLTRAPVSVFTRQQYEQTVQRVRDYIAQGDVFQVNLAQRFSAEGKGNPRALYQRLAQTSPAWYGAYLELCNGRVLASTSPELFLQVEPTGRVVTRPIKGTRPASDPVNNLLKSAKDIAELNMIVDLLRNDLGRVVCVWVGFRWSSPVKSKRIRRCITAWRRSVGNCTHHGISWTSCVPPWPGGSITGAPKIRAMQIIDELEPVRRGPYCGAIGWITAEALCLNIAIRTLQLTPGGSDKPLLPPGESEYSLRAYQGEGVTVVGYSLFQGLFAPRP
ncbi:MAG: hypothetical protein HC898_07540, partial [Phycisphaerales bacterium]|nr:hypothetical protein [Phycisphaerales bacterium]